MKYKALILIFASFLLYNFQCHEPPPCDNRVFNSGSIEVDLAPEQVTYNIGDTIWISTKFNTEIKLSDGSGVFRVPNKDGVLKMIIAYMDEGKNITRGYDDFEITNRIGELIPNESTSDNTLNYQGSLYFSCGAFECEFEVGIIPQNEGNYSLTISEGRMNINDRGDCVPRNYLMGNTFDVDSYNRQLYTEYNLPDEIILPTSNDSTKLEVRNSDATYTFRVK